MRSLFLFACLSVCLTPLACNDDTTDPIKNTVTCADVCSRYQDCIDDEVDVGDCTSKCEDEATEDESVEDRLEGCETCLDDKSCSDSVFRCSDDCIGIVPP